MSLEKPHVFQKWSYLHGKPLWKQNTENIKWKFNPKNFKSVNQSGNTLTVTPLDKVVSTEIQVD